jgi:branched-chain amino acid transport system substrate-binding protein
MWRRTRGAVVVLALVGSLIGATGVVASGPASAASSKAPIIIGMVTEETGSSSSGYANSQFGAQARINAQNAIGGVDGHKLQLVVEDDQSTPSGNLVAAETLVSTKNVFSVIDLSSYTFAAAKYLNQQGVPVVGAAVDGPEWGQKPNSNMFSVYGTPLTPYNGKLYSYTDGAELLKDLGVTKLAQSVANVPSAISAADELFAEAKPLGISDCLDSVSPVGAVDFTTFVLQMKKNGCNGVEVLDLLATCIAAQTAIKQANLKVADVCATGYDQAVLSQPAALAAMQGTYTGATINVLGDDLSAPVKLYLKNLKKYSAFAGGIPTLNMDYGYESADLIIKGLELTGGKASRPAFISDLRKISSYTAGGLIAAPGINFTHFGTLASLPKTACAVYYEVKGHSYVPALGGKPVCGKLISTGSA